MRAKDDVTPRSAFRRSPVRMSLYVCVPLLLAVLQLANSLLTDLPVWVAAAFAVLMVSYAVMFTRYHVAQLRLEELESGPLQPTAD